MSEPALCLRSMRIRTLLRTCTSRKRCFSDTRAVREAGCRGFSSCSMDLRQRRPSLHLHKILRSQSAVFKRQSDLSLSCPTPFIALRITFQALPGLQAPSPAHFLTSSTTFAPFCVHPRTHEPAFSSSNVIRQFLHGAFTTCHSVGLMLCPTSAPAGCCFLCMSDSNVTFAAKFPLPTYLPPAPAPHYHANLSWRHRSTHSHTLECSCSFTCSPVYCPCPFTKT